VADPSPRLQVLADPGWHGPDRAALEALMAPAMVTHAVNRSFTWLGAIAGGRLIAYF